MGSPDELPQRKRLKARFRRQAITRGTTADDARYYEDDDGHRYPSTTTITGRVDFSEFPDDSPLHESSWPLQRWKQSTPRWWVKYWYKRQLGILAHYAITSQMDVSTPDDTASVRAELIDPSDESVRHLSRETIFDTLRTYDDVGLAATEWTYGRYPAEHPLLDVAQADAEAIADCWRSTIRPELDLEYDDVWGGELMFVRQLDGGGWPPLGYGGQIDLVANLRDAVRAVDLKTGTLRMEHRMQATAYQHAFPEIEGATLIHVSPTGEWAVEWSEEWPQDSLWQQFRAEVVLADRNDAFEFS